MKIIKRTKSKKKYFYLQHSFRDNGKVITKEKYLGKKIPNDIKKIREELEKESKRSLYKKLKRIKENFQKEWSKYPNTVKEREKEEIALALTYNTNAIEGSTITLEETREIIQNKIAPNKSLADIKETESHFKVILNILNKKEKITKFLILEWHNEIFKETKNEIAGKFRDYLVRVADYRAPDWRDINELIKKYIKFINESKINPVELAAIAHYRFEKIHPFGDGNGRIGRLLINHILWHNNYPLLIIEHKKRKSYYKALQKDKEGFVKYFLRKYLSIHKKRI